MIKKYVISKYLLAKPEKVYYDYVRGIYCTNINDATKFSDYEFPLEVIQNPSKKEIHDTDSVYQIEEILVPEPK